MCTEAVSQVLLEDELIQNLMADPAMDVLHQQVLMTLYSLDVAHRLEQVRTLLPIYLGMKWDRCSEVLDIIAKVGLIKREGDDVKLTHPIARERLSSECGCG